MVASVRVDPGGATTGRPGASSPSLFLNSPKANWGMEASRDFHVSVGLIPAGTATDQLNAPFRRINPTVTKRDTQAFLCLADQSSSRRINPTEISAATIFHLEQ